MYPSPQSIYIYIHTHRFAQKAANKYRRVNARSRVCVHVSPLSFSLSLFTVLAKYGRSGGGGSSLSVATRGKQSKRPSVESGQPVCPPAVERERERPALVPSLATFLLSFAFSLSSATSAPPIYIHPSRFKPRRYQLHRGCPDPLLIVRRCSAV